jgi:hypothetical protein
MESQDLVNLKRAYNEAYVAGDSLPRVERQILIASIADSARKTTDRLTARGVEKKHIDEMESLVAALSRQDSVGSGIRGLANIATKTAAEATQGALSVFWTLGIGGVVGAVVAGLANVSGLFVQIASAIADAGQAAGQLTAVALGVVPSYLLFRGLAYLGKALQNSTTGMTNPVSALWDDAERIGRGADAVLDTHVRPIESTFFVAGSQPSRAIPARIRGTAKLLTVVALVTFTMAVLLFGAAALDGFNAANSQRRSLGIPLR